MEEKDYSFFEEEKDPVTKGNEEAPIDRDAQSEPVEIPEAEVPTDPQAEASAEPQAVEAEAVSETPKKKKRRLWIIPVVVGGVFALALAVAMILFAPLFLTDPFENTLDAILFDTAEFESLLSTYERKGEQGEMEINIPSELSGLDQKISIELDYLSVDDKTKGTVTFAANTKSSSVSYDFYVDDETVALAGLLQDEDKFVSLPRKNGEEQAEESIFAYDGKSNYKLDKETYETLVELLNFISTDDSSEAEEKENAAFDAAIERILEIIDEELETDYDFALAEDGFGFSMTETYSLDSKSITKILNAIIEEAEDNKTLDELITFTDDDGEAMTLSEKCKALKKEWKNPEMSFSYTVVGGKLTELTYFFQLDNEYKKHNKTELVVEFLYDEDDLGFDLVLKTVREGKTNDIADVTEGSYRKEVFEKKTVFTYKDEFNQKIGDKNLGASKKKSEVVLTYKNSGDWRLEMSDSETSVETAFYGTFELDSAEDTFDFCWEGMSVGKMELNKNFVKLSFSTPQNGKQVTTPEHTNLLTLDEEAFGEVFQSIRISKPIKLIDTWLGIPLLENSVAMTSNGELFWDYEALLEIAGEYYNAYCDEVGEMGLVSVYVYCEEYDIYVLMNIQGAEFSYELTEQQKKDFKKAEITNGVIKLFK